MADATPDGSVDDVVESFTDIKPAARSPENEFIEGLDKDIAINMKEEDIDYEDIKNVESDLIFLGLIGIRDPPRSEAYEAIATCHEAGFRGIMITGDQEYTAKSVKYRRNVFCNRSQSSLQTC